MRYISLSNRSEVAAFTEPIDIVYVHLHLEGDDLGRVCRLAREKLVFSEIEGLDTAIIAASITNSSVERLYMSECGLRDADMANLAPVFPTMPRLKALDLGENLFTDAGLEMLAHVIPQCPSLVNVHFGANQAVTDTGVLAVVRGFNARPSLLIHILDFWRIRELQVLPQTQFELAWGRGLRYWGPRVLPLLVPGRTPAQVWAWMRDGDHAMMYRVVQFLVE